MTRYSFIGIVGATLLALPPSCTKRLPHGGDNPVYPLRGLHAAVPCEGCHGPGTPEALTTSCLECHVDDRPSADHHPGQECYPCHTEDGWAVGVYPTGETGTPPILDTAPTGDTGGTTTAPKHPVVPETMLCWDCHEKERKDALHYTDPDPLKMWDCGPCHGKADWAKPVYEHPARTPHGTYKQDVAQPDSAWIVACTSCHPTSLLEFDCTNACHNGDFFPHFGTYEPGPEANDTCMGCHPAAAL